VKPAQFSYLRPDGLAEACGGTRCTYSGWGGQALVPRLAIASVVVGRITDTMIAVSRIIYSGHVERYSKAKIVAGIGGAALPYIIGRLRRNYSLAEDTLADPDKALSMMYYDTLLHDPSALELLLGTVGPGRIMLGSDMPFPIGDSRPLTILDEAHVMGDARIEIKSGVVSRLLDL
jgi:aminocarboxymuconate-semialdehyde decarboxylase